MRVLLIALFVLAGCAHPSGRPITRDELVGTYANGDPFWPRSLDLNADGSFDYRQLTDMIDAEGRFEGSWGFYGSWKFVAPDRVELSTDTQEEPVLVFARRSRKVKLAILEPDLYPTILADWSDDGGFGYLRKRNPKRPIQPPQRNAGSRPSSDDSSASESPSSLCPRG